MLLVAPTDLPEVKVLQYEKHYESRGCSHCIFSREKLRRVGIEADFKEETMYCPQKAGTLYGIHFQNHPFAQTKLLYCLRGRGVDFAVDLRKHSKTFKQWVSVELSAENRRQILIPPGFGHAFLSLEDDTAVLMRIDCYFDEKYRRGIAWNDPELNIGFPISRPILAMHDQEAPLLRDSDCNF